MNQPRYCEALEQGHLSGREVGLWGWAPLGGGTRGQGPPGLCAVSPAGL